MKKTIYLTILAVITTLCIIGGSFYHIGGWFGFYHTDSGNLLEFISLGNADGENAASGQNSSRESSTETFERADFDSVKIDGTVLDITIETADTDHYTLSYDCVSYLIPQISIENGRLTVKQPSLPKLANSTNTCRMTLTIPADVQLTSLNIQTDVGDCSIYGIASGQVTLQSDVGNINAVSCDFSYTNIEADVGEIKLEQCNLTNAELSTDVGEINLSDCDFTNLDISSDLGDVALQTALDLSDYEMELSTDLGSIDVNGTNYKKEYRQKGSSAKELDIENEVGSIELNYSPVR